MTSSAAESRPDFSYFAVELNRSVIVGSKLSFSSSC